MQEALAMFHIKLFKKTKCILQAVRVKISMVDIPQLSSHCYPVMITHYIFSSFLEKNRHVHKNDKIRRLQPLIACFITKRPNIFCCSFFPSTGIAEEVIFRLMTFECPKLLANYKLSMTIVYLYIFKQE